METIKTFVADNAKYILAGAVGVFTSAVASIIKDKKALKEAEANEAEAVDENGHPVQVEVIESQNAIDPVSQKIAEIQKAADDAIEKIKAESDKDVAKPVQFTTVNA